MQRGFQLMGHVGGEFPAQRLRLFLFRNVEKEQRRPGGLVPGDDGGGLQPVPSMPKRNGLLRPLPAQGLFHRVLQADVSVKRQDVRANTESAVPQNLRGGGVDADDFALPVQQDHALAHAAHNGIQRILLSLKRRLLPFELLLLGLRPPQEGHELLVSAIERCRVQIQLGQRPHDSPGNIHRQKRGQDDRHKEHGADGLRHAKRQRQDRVLRNGQPQHRAVRQALGGIQGAEHQGGGIAQALAVAGGEGLHHLLPRQMVFTGDGLAVVEHRAVRADPSDAVMLNVQALKIPGSLVGDALGRQHGLHLQLCLLYLGKIAVQDAHNQGQ